MDVGSARGAVPLRCLDRPPPGAPAGDQLRVPRGLLVQETGTQLVPLGVPVQAPDSLSGPALGSIPVSPMTSRCATAATAGHGPSRLATSERPSLGADGLAPDEEQKPAASLLKRFASRLLLVRLPHPPPSSTSSLAPRDTRAATRRPSIPSLCKLREPGLERASAVRAPVSLSSETERCGPSATA